MGDGAATGANGPLEVDRILEIFEVVDEASVLGQGEEHGLWMAPLIHHKSRFQLDHAIAPNTQHTTDAPRPPM